MPIKSVGIIHIQDQRVLMVRRKHSFGYMDFVRGNYPITSLSQVTNYISEMTLREKENVRTMSFPELWNDIWGKHPIGSINQRMAEDKFNKLKSGIHNESLDSILNKCTSSWSEPEWGFPKGRRNQHETDLCGALREYEEETGYSASSINIITNLLPFEEVFIGSNYKAYKHVYFVGISSEPSPSKSFQLHEIGDMKLFSFQEAFDIVRPYNIERIQLITTLKSLLNYEII
jgi:ADP-ribose pyrophosphatase YjhB (NUDIX family)